MHHTGINLKNSFNLATHRPVGWVEGYFTNQFDHQLRYSFCPSSKTQSRGTIVLTHGYGEFIDQYYLLMREYQDMGFDVWAMDFYGFGKSGRDNPDDPHRLSTKGLMRHVKDLDFFLNNIVKHDTAKPLIHSTHSMGGHVGLLYIQRNPDRFDGAVMSSPLFDFFRFGLPVVFRPAIRTAFKVAAGIGLGDHLVPVTLEVWDRLVLAGKVAQGLADKVIQEVTDSPTPASQPHLRMMFKMLVSNQITEANVQRPSIGFIDAAYPSILRSMRRRELVKMDTPMLIGSAGLESLVDESAHRRVASLAKNVELFPLPFATHSLWFQPPEIYDPWMEKVNGFLNQIAPPPHVYKPGQVREAADIHSTAERIPPVVLGITT